MTQAPPCTRTTAGNGPSPSGISTVALGCGVGMVVAAGWVVDVGLRSSVVVVATVVVVVVVEVARVGWLLLPAVSGVAVV